MTTTTKLDAALDPELDAALAITLANLTERELALVRRHATLHSKTGQLGPDAWPEATAELKPETRERLRLLREQGETTREARRAELLGLELVPWSSARYPAALLDLTAPPALLYLRGEGAWPPPDPVTIVGARASTARGRAFAHELGAGVAARGGCVASGLAIGIDQAAHEGALENGGAVVAVLACGVDAIYPPGALPLAHQIERAGRIVSEMALGTPPYKDHFPRRNRILAALSRTTLVVEADERSGSLITANRALELGRNVLAMPGPIDAPTSRGTNRLIRDGAHPLLAIEDLDLLLAGKAGTASGAGNGAAGAAADELLAALAAPASAEEIATRLGSALDRVLLRLADLEADGRITRIGGGLYSRTT